MRMGKRGGAAILVILCAGGIPAQEPTTTETAIGRRLAAAKPDGRRKLLEVEKVPVTPGLIRAVLNEGDGILGKSAPQALEFYRFGMELAEQSGDRPMVCS